MVKMFKIIGVSMLLYGMGVVCGHAETASRNTVAQYIQGLSNSVVLNCEERLLSAGAAESTLSEEGTAWYALQQYLYGSDLFIFRTCPSIAPGAIVLSKHRLISLDVIFDQCPSQSAQINQVIQNDLTAMAGLKNLYVNDSNREFDPMILNKKRKEVLDILTNVYQSHMIMEREEDVEVIGWSVSCDPAFTTRLISFWKLLRNSVTSGHNEFEAWRHFSSFNLKDTNRQELFEYGCNDHVFGISIARDFYDSDDMPFLLMVLYAELRAYVICPQYIIQYFVKTSMNIVEKKYLSVERKGADINSKD